MSDRLRRSSRKQQLLKRQPDKNVGEWKNTSADCQDDAIQIIFNNSKGKEKEVSFHIVNSGSCPVKIGVSPSRKGGVAPKDSQKIPGGSKEQVAITIPAGYFLVATCDGHDDQGCAWTISELKC